MASAGDIVAEIPVWMGDHQQINAMVTKRHPDFLVPAIGQDSVETRVEYRTPLEAPIALGGQVAELVITARDMPEKRIPLVSDRDVDPRRVPAPDPRLGRRPV